MSTSNQNVWIMGCGDIGRRVGRLYQNEGVKAIGWVRGEESLRLGLEQGLAMRKGDVDQGSFFPIFALDEALVYWFMPPPPKGETDDRLRRFLKGVDAAPKRVVLISTTGVYGDCGGRWIDESEPLKPVAARARRRVDAEETVQAWAARFGGETVILRVPGIYAPDRLPLERLKRSEPVLREEEAPWTNRIHADDLAMVCKRAMEAAPAGAIYNAVDGSPSSMTAYFNQVADYAGLPRPPQVSRAEAPAVMGAGMLSYLQESRRIRNDKLLTELGIRLQYPSLAAGLGMTGG
ncbi:NAD-dependent epimerase/dehydratase family protein [Candidatus Thiothrix sp. Deng01]|uniref:NAD-dependent epimerase/dehydratase family protein n=1 Tax=Candidatus Thiothrix phosphatis TaxID=3112415 RepID=A0ABU6CZD1_9GAMM|nr:NAD-dependent epimerase/dehydratase family protein [Candidatus Thiothrix sp. Deng01]MEB4592196.1 NAD-dependent epimerase/dehydratase family protein [Candidatus Thiothrix sp. Deng01]